MLRGLRLTRLLFQVRIHYRLAIRHQGTLRRHGRILHGLPSDTLPRDTPLRPRQLFPRLRPLNPIRLVGQYNDLIILMIQGFGLSPILIWVYD